MEQEENTTIYNEIESIIKDNTIYHLATEMSNIDNEERKSKLLKAINKLQHVNIDDKEIVKKKREQIIENMEKQSFKKTWRRLKPFQKETKLTEYLGELYKNQVTNDKITGFIKKGLTDGYFKNDVTYDDTLCTITSIKETICVKDDTLIFQNEIPKDESDDDSSNSETNETISDGETTEEDTKTKDKTVKVPKKTESDKNKVKAKAQTNAKAKSKSTVDEKTKKTSNRQTKKQSVNKK